MSTMLRVRTGAAETLLAVQRGDQAAANAEVWQAIATSRGKDLVRANREIASLQEALGRTARDLLTVTEERDRATRHVQVLRRRCCLCLFLRRWERRSK